MLRRRAAFLRVRGGRRWSTPGFVIEMRPHAEPATGMVESNRAPGLQPSAATESAPPPARFGFTATKKLGNAVLRNRIRRRLKELVRTISGEHAAAGCDYVLIARPGAADRPFDDMRHDLIQAFSRLGNGTSPDQSRERSKQPPRGRDRSSS